MLPDITEQLVLDGSKGDDDADHRRRKRMAVDHLSCRLRQAREAHGLSQEEVAQAARISVFAYGCLERGRSTAGGDANPTLDTVVRVFNVLGIDLYEEAPARRTTRHSGSTTEDQPQ